MKSLIQSPTNSLQLSVEFYSKLNFQNISSETRTLFADGAGIIEINPNRFARAGIKLFQKHWEEEVKRLEKETTVRRIEGGFLLAESSGTWIYLMESEEEFRIPSRSKSNLGNYAGISLECIDIQKSLQILKILGFEESGGNISQGWLSLSNQDGFSISLMLPESCPHLFFNPSLNYFNGESNMEVIEQLRQMEIPIVEEITAFNSQGLVDNVIIKDPGGLGFFLFSD